MFCFRCLQSSLDLVLNMSDHPRSCTILSEMRQCHTVIQFLTFRFSRETFWFLKTVWNMTLKVESVLHVLQVWVCAPVRVCGRARMCACGGACVCVCVSAWSLQQNTANVGLIVSSNNDFWGWQNCTRLGLRPALVLANTPSPKQP